MLGQQLLGRQLKHLSQLRSRQGLSCRRPSLTRCAGRQVCCWGLTLALVVSLSKLRGNLLMQQLCVLSAVNSLLPQDSIPDSSTAAARDAVTACESKDEAKTCAVCVQIVSANAYFLVYRHCPRSSATAAGQQAAAAAEEAAAVKQEQQPTQQQEPLEPQQAPLQARDQNVQLPQQQAGQPAEQQLVTKQESALQQADTAQQQQQPPEGVSEQQLPLAAQQLQAQLQELPETVQQQVAQLHRDFDEMCGRFQQRRQEAMAAVEHRKQVGPGHQLGAGVSCKGGSLALFFCCVAVLNRHA